MAQPEKEPKKEPMDEPLDEPAADRLRMDLGEEVSRECSFVIDEKIDDTLEATSQRINLTAKNVRSILHVRIMQYLLVSVASQNLTQVKEKNQKF